MIYTIGIKENYDRYIEEFTNPPAQKDIGGTCWLYESNARCYLQNINFKYKNYTERDYAVYGLEAEEKDTEFVPFGPYGARRLLKIAKIVKI